jgi:hypothetical protein
MSYYIGYFEIAAFLSSLIAWPQLRKSSYLKWFPLLLFVIIVVEIPQYFFRSYLPQDNSLIYNIQVPLQHVIYLFILHQAVVKLSWKKAILMGGVFFIAFTFITALFFTDPGRFNVLSYCMGLLFIIVSILMKFYEVLQNPTDFNFMRKPFFYILFAFLLFSVSTLPYFAMINWLNSNQAHKEIAEVFKKVMSIFNYILYATYTFAFLWMSLKKVHS